MSLCILIAGIYLFSLKFIESMGQYDMIALILFKWLLLAWFFFLFLIGETFYCFYFGFNTNVHLFRHHAQWAYRICDSIWIAWNNRPVRCTGRNGHCWLGGASRDYIFQFNYCLRSFLFLLLEHLNFCALYVRFTIHYCPKRKKHKHTGFERAKKKYIMKKYDRGYYSK